ncbi:MAG: hypothetical protein OEY56_10850 [Cyclobacteriaceae bacterium]|nr:hypothetical protein [Cyclobacteriaceae bacterium]
MKWKSVLRKTKANRNVSLTLRILLLLTAFFFALFSVDVFSEGYPMWEMAGAFLIHNIFTFMLLLLLLIALRWEQIAGTFLVLMGLTMSVILGGTSHAMTGTWLLIGFLILLGVLFLVNHYLGRRKNPTP